MKQMEHSKIESKDLKNKITEVSNNYLQVLQQTHDQALLQNEVQTKRLEGYQKEYEELKERLLFLRDKLSHEIMVPLGKKALMKGRLVHTNEIMVCLGDGWFAKRTASQAAEICQRRVESFGEVLKNLEKERDLLASRKTFPFDNEAFGANETQEVVELYDEEEEKKWRERHRQKEKEYREKLAELRKAQNTKIETEEDLWKRLEALDIEEELEDELNRLDEDNEEEVSDDSEDESDSDDSELASSKDSETEQTVVRNKNVLERRVSFKEESKTESQQSNELISDEDTIQISFKHSDSAVSSKNKLGSEILCPSDIYLQYLRQKVPKSILKPSTSVESILPEPFIPASGNVLHSPVNAASRAVNHKPLEPAVKPVSEEVVERASAALHATSDSRPVSRFKAERMAKKQ